MCPFPGASEPPWRSQLAHAERQLQLLRDSIAEYVATKPWSSRVTFEYRPLDNGMIECTTEAYAQLTSRAPEAVGHQVGDILKSFRSSLEYLAKGISSEPGRAQFPIYTHERDYEGRDVARKLRGISPQARAIIRELQPFNDPNGVEANPLWQLNALRNVDIHSNPNSATAALVHAELSIGAGMIGFQYSPGQIPLPQGLSFDEERLVMRTVSQVHPDWADTLIQDPGLGWAVVFGPDTPLPLRSLRTTLGRIHSHLETVVLSRLEPFAQR